MTTPNAPPTTLIADVFNRWASMRRDDSIPHHDHLNHASFAAMRPYLAVIGRYELSEDKPAQTGGTVAFLSVGSAIRAALGLNDGHPVSALPIAAGPDISFSDAYRRAAADQEPVFGIAQLPGRHDVTVDAGFGVFPLMGDSGWPEYVLCCLDLSSYEGGRSADVL